jgi:hypothetical protein
MYYNLFRFYDLKIINSNINNNLLLGLKLFYNFIIIFNATFTYVIYVYYRIIKTLGKSVNT